MASIRLNFEGDAPDPVGVLADRLVDETETVLEATAMAEDFEMQTAQISHIAGMRPEQAKELKQRALALAKSARTESRLVAVGDRLLRLPGLRRLAR